MSLNKKEKTINDFFNLKQYNINNNKENNKIIKTYCTEKSNDSHDLNYIWCKICNKIFCTNCSYSHLLTEKREHPRNSLYSKPLLDAEFKKLFKKVELLDKNMKEIFYQNNKFLYSCTVLYKLINSFDEHINKFFLMIKTFKDNLIKNITDIFISSDKLKELKEMENKMIDNMDKIFKGFKSIENKYYLCKEFVPKEIKLYYEEFTKLSDDYIKLEKTFDDFCKNKFSDKDKENIDIVQYKLNIILNNIIKKFPLEINKFNE